jgi:hypothetical protein
MHPFPREMPGNYLNQISTAFLNNDQLQGKIRKSFKKVKIEEFAEHYKPESIMADLQEAKRLEEQWKKAAAEDPSLLTQKNISKLLEAITADQAASYGLFGEGVETLPIVPYDDYINKIDVAVEFKDGQILGLDATYSSDLGKKFAFIKKIIEQDNLGTIKYRESTRFPEKFNADSIPITIVGIDPQLLADIAPNWIRNPEVLKTNKSRLIILEEIYEQLNAFRQFAITRNKPNSIEKLTEMIAKIEPLLQKERKVINVPKAELMLNDRVFQLLHFHAESFAKQKE